MAAARVKRTNYVRANDGKFAHTPGSGAKAKPKPAAKGSKVKPKAATSKAKTTAPKVSALSAAKSISAAEQKLSAKGGTAGGTIDAKGFHKTYGVKVKKLKGGGSVRTVTRHTTKVVNGKKVNVDVTRETTTDAQGHTTVKRTVGTGKSAKTTVTHGGSKPAVKHKAATGRKVARRK
jgi:hypothetical protein